MGLTLEGIKERREQLGKDFDVVKKQREQTQAILATLDIKLYRLQGKHELLNDLEKEIKEKKPE